MMFREGSIVTSIIASAGGFITAVALFFWRAGKIETDLSTLRDTEMDHHKATAHRIDGIEDRMAADVSHMRGRLDRFLDKQP